MEFIRKVFADSDCKISGVICGNESRDHCDVMDDVDALLDSEGLSCLAIVKVLLFFT